MVDDSGDLGSRIMTTAVTIMVVYVRLPLLIPTCHCSGGTFYHRSPLFSLPDITVVVHFTIGHRSGGTCYHQSPPLIPT